MQAQFSVGDRVQLLPATDLWMRGARFGDVKAINMNREGTILYVLDCEALKDLVRVTERNIGGLA